MVLTKDDKLCPAVLSALNKDLAEYGEIRYATHQETPVIRWHLMKELGSRLEDSECEQFRWAKFDINNDGKPDLVVKYSSCAHDLLHDQLFIFDSGYKGLKAVRAPHEFFGAYGKFGIGRLTLGAYTFPEIPETSIYTERITTSMVLTPFRYGEATYFHLDPMIPTLVERVYMHVVAKYTRAPLGNRKPETNIDNGHPLGWQDVCYFKTKVEEFRALERKQDGLTLRP